MADDCYNCETLEDHESFGDVCGPPRQGGMSGAVFTNCGFALTEEESENGTTVQTAIDNDQAMLFNQISMSLDGSEPVLSQFAASPCDLPRVLYVNWTGTIRDLAFTKQNFENYVRLVNGYRFSGLIAKLCDQDGWDDHSLYMSGNISFSGSPLIPLESSDTSRFELTYTFRGSVALIDTPTGVFD